MSTVLELRFPWGRYHATPWGRNVNEGVVDWPPSPWRLLRALYATWQWRADDIPATAIDGLLSALVAAPRYWLPRYTIAHTRHYYPRLTHRRGIAGATDKTLDTFVVTERDERVLVEWPVELSDEQRYILARLADDLGYVGRADSIVDARLLPKDERLPDDGWFEPGGRGATTSCLAPVARLDLHALLMTPSAVRAGRVLSPPQTRWVEYTRPRPVPLSVRSKPVPSVPATALRFALSAPALPSRNAAVALGDLLHKVACKLMPTSALLRGTDDDGRPLGGPHGHAHYVAFPSDHRDKRVDCMVIWVPAGLLREEVDEFSKKTHVLRGGPHLGLHSDLTVAFEAAGTVSEVAPEIAGVSSDWCSLTPYAPVRHSRKLSLAALIRQDVTRELAYRDLPAPADVELVKGPWLAYRRHRPGERLSQARRAVGVRLRFAEPVAGPLALGQLSHFGLGLFRPME